MRTKTVPERLLGTMITYGYPKLSLDSELDLAARLEARVLEILPDWRAFPDPHELRRVVADRGLAIHSAHGCWGGQTIRASRVDLGATDPPAHRESVDDLKRCVDWLEAAGGKHLVVHPGGLSLPVDLVPRREALGRGLVELAEHADGSGLVVCVENMPPGVFPGSRMQDLFDLLLELDQPRLALALDTGHAHISSSLATETLAAGRLLATTHVHDNDGRQDSHEPPGRGTIDWAAWADPLDDIDYHGAIMLECIRRIRSDPASFRPEVLEPLLHVPGGGRALESQRL
jgi:sugar phosphate isomerase/epimerase